MYIKHQNDGLDTKKKKKEPKQKFGLFTKKKQREE